jgi:hypothetical protein
MYVKCTADRLALHALCGDRYAQHRLFSGGVIADFLIDRLPFARTPAWVKGSGADSASGLGVPNERLRIQVCFRQLQTLHHTRCGRQMGHKRSFAGALCHE